MGLGGLLSYVSKRCQNVKKMENYQKDVKRQKVKQVDGGGSQKSK